MVQTIIAKPFTGLPKIPDIEVPTNVTGPIYQLKRYMGATSSLSLVPVRTHGNLTLANGSIVAGSILNNGVVQTAIVRESFEKLAIEYPVNIKGLGEDVPDPVPVTLELKSPQYRDTLDGSGFIENRPNWTVTPGDEGKFEVAEGTMYYNHLYGQTRQAFYGPDITAQELRIGYVTGNDWDRNRFSMKVWYIDEQNHIRITLTSGGGIIMESYVDGTMVSRQAPTRPNVAKPSGTILIRTDDTGLRVSWDGEWSRANGNDFTYPYDGFSMADLGIPPANRHGVFAISMSTWTYPILDSISVTPIKVIVDGEDQFVGRDSTSVNVGTASISGRYNGPDPAHWYVRVLDQAMSPVTGWGVPKSSAVSGGVFVFDVSAPVGGPYTYQVAMVDTDGKAWVDNSRLCLVGRGIASLGQSNSYGQGAILLNQPLVDTAAALINPDLFGAPIPNDRWATGFNPYSPPAIMGTALTVQSLLRMPVGIIAGGQNATPISGLIPGSGGWTRMMNQVAPFKGVIEVIIWDQGEGDADGVSFTSDYEDVWENTLYPALKILARNDDVIVLIAGIGNYPGQEGLNGNSSAKLDNQRRLLRQAQQNLVDRLPNVHWASYKTGIDHGNDPYHYTNPAYATDLGKRNGQTIAKVLGVSTYDGQGSIITEGVRTDKVIRLQLDPNGADGIFGPITKSTFGLPRIAAPTNSFMGYEVSNDDFVTLLKIDSITTDNNELVITLHDNVSGTIKVRSMQGGTYDDTQLFMSMYADGSSIPVAPINKPIVITA